MWSTIVKSKSNIKNKPIEKPVQIKTEIIDIEEVSNQNRFMDYFGYKTSLLWERLKTKTEYNNLLTIPKSSLNLHDFLYQNLNLKSTDLGIKEEDSEDYSSDDYVE
tara:strand:- start:1504 stop:1821 length:318 start_codon:yes stop_codon:yes gene_type:complete